MTVNPSSGVLCCGNGWQHWFRSSIQFVGGWRKHKEEGFLTIFYTKLGVREIFLFSLYCIVLSLGRRFVSFYFTFAFLLFIVDLLRKFSVEFVVSLQ